MTESEELAVRRIVREEIAAALELLSTETRCNIPDTVSVRELDTVSWALRHGEETSDGD